LYSSLNLIRIIKSWKDGHVVLMEDARNAYRISVGKPEGGDTTKVDLKGTGVRM